MTLAQSSAVDFEHIDFALTEIENLPELLRSIRSTTPAVWVTAYGQPALLLTSYELVDTLLHDEATFPSAPFYLMQTEIMGKNMLAMSGKEHRVNRALASPSFRPRIMSALKESLLEPLAHELVDAFEARGSADLVAEFTVKYPARIIMRLLGLPPHMDDEVQRWAKGFLNSRADYEESMACVGAFTEFVQPILDRRRRDPGDDVLSMLATTELDGEKLTDEEIFAFLKLLFPAGADTTYLNLGSTLFALLSFPDQMAKVRADPQNECRWAAEEGLRWYPSVAMLPRITPAAVEWNGVEIPANTTIISSFLAANRDPKVFEDPDRFDVGRRSSRTLTFGQGVHVCLGLHLARAEMDVALRVILERLPRLRWAEGAQSRLRGAMGEWMRGPDALPVRFD